jgi:hypothetical protein
VADLCAGEGRRRHADTGQQHGRQTRMIEMLERAEPHRHRGGRTQQALDRLMAESAVGEWNHDGGQAAERPRPGEFGPRGIPGIVQDSMEFALCWLRWSLRRARSIHNLVSTTLGCFSTARRRPLPITKPSVHRSRKPAPRNWP